MLIFSRSLHIFLILLIGSSGSIAAIAATSPTVSPSALTPQARETLRYRLELVHNDADLLIQNATVDQRDLDRTRKEAEILKINERIPLKTEGESFKKQLRESARARGLKIEKLVFSGKPKGKALAVPKKIFADAQPPFRLKEEHLVDRLPFRVRVQGSLDEARAWTDTWREELMRLAEVGELRPMAGGKSVEIQGHVFRFRPIEFPKIVFRDPLEYLPAWVKKNPQAFAKNEPQLWRFVKAIRELGPKTKPYQATRREFMLQQARSAFFFEKAGPRGGHAAHQHSH